MKETPIGEEIGASLYRLPAIWFRRANGAAGSMGFVASGKQSITSFCGEGDHDDGGPT